VRRALIALIAISIVWALAVALTGGIDLRPRGIPFKSTDSDRATILVLVLVLAYALAYREQTRSHLRWVDAQMPLAVRWIERRAPGLAAIISAGVLAVGYVYGVHVAGGSDSYGYISQADLWLAGDLIVEQPLVGRLPWPNADWSLAPLGYRPTPDGSAIVPTYSYGLPVLMAIGKLLAGICGVYLVTPLLGALAVAMTYVLGAQVSSRTTGVVAAALLGTSPAFLFMQMNPMSDVPVSAMFAAGVVLTLSRLRWAPFWTGVVVSMAIFVRPNLVPLGAVFLGWFVIRPGTWRERLRAVAGFGAGGFPLVAAVAATNAQLHGAPWQSGYGSLADYYAWDYVLTNLPYYTTQVLRTETPFVVLLAVPLVMLRRIDAERRARLTFLYVFAGGVWLSYLFYVPYDAWWYLRFYLPAFPPMFVLALVGYGQWLGGRNDRRALAFALVVVVVIGMRAASVRDLAILHLWQEGTVYTSAARYVQTELPANAVILTVQHSGSMRYYADRLTVRWDWIAAEWWPRALNALVQLGYRPYLLVSHFEEATLRSQFSLGEAADAPGTIVAESLGVVLYDPLREYVGDRQVIPTVVSCPCSD
jgi:hypothetical protein